MHIAQDVNQGNSGHSAVSSSTPANGSPGGFSAQGAANMENNPHSSRSQRYSMYMNYFKGAANVEPLNSQFPFQTSYQNTVLGPTIYFRSPEPTQPIAPSIPVAVDNNLVSPPTSLLGTQMHYNFGKIFGPANWIRHLQPNLNGSIDNPSPGTGHSPCNGVSTPSCAITGSSNTAPLPLHSNAGFGHRDVHTPFPPRKGADSLSQKLSRQAGYDAFVYRQMNGVSNKPTSSNKTSNWRNSPNIPNVILCTFLVYFMVVGLLYYVNIQIQYHASSNSGEPNLNEEQIIKRSLLINSAAFPKLNFPICGLKGVDVQACVQKQFVKGSRILFRILKNELVERAKWKDCRPNVKDNISLQDAKIILYNISDMGILDVDNCFPGMLILCHENPRWGLKIEVNGMSEKNLTMQQVLEANPFVTVIAAVGVRPLVMCRFWSGLFMSTPYIIFFVVFIFSARRLYARYVRIKQMEEEEIYEYYKRIVDILQSRYELIRRAGGDSFLVVDHIRDQLIPERDRESKGPLWDELVNYISTNDCPIREDMRCIGGEDYRMWSFLPPRPDAPTTCVKIRIMVNAETVSCEARRLSLIQGYILKYCADSQIVHIGVNFLPNQRGNIYVKCLEKKDAGQVYVSLQTSWFENYMLSIKFLPEELYVARFPESAGKTVPLSIE